MGKIETEIAVDQKQIDLGHELGDWFVFRETRHFGPLATKQIHQFLLAKLLSTKHYLWRPGLGSWIRIESIEAFKSCGHEDIQLISDNDFSFRAELGIIDRIRFQETEMSFQKNFIDQSIDIRKNTLATLKLLVKDHYYSTLKTIGVSENYFKSCTKAILCIGVVLFCFVVYLAAQKISEIKMVKNISSPMREKLISNAKLKETNINPKLILVKNESNKKEHVFVGSVNAPEGSLLKFKVDGDPKTLLGTYRYTKTFELKTKSKYFQTEPLKGVNEKNIVPGFYSISVICLSCEKELELYNQVFRLGVSDLADYNKLLQMFHIVSREKATTEIDELSGLHDSILNQYQNSKGIYNRSVGLKSLASWTKFSSGWLATQKNIADTLQKMQREGFKDNVYYLPLYEAFGELAKMISELHVMHDRYLTTSDKSLVAATKISDATEDIKLKLTNLKSQVELMKANLKKSKGLPPLRGLVLNNNLNKS